MNKYDDLLAQFNLGPELGHHCVEFVDGDGYMPPPLAKLIDDSEACQNFIDEALSRKFRPLQEAVRALLLSAGTTPEEQWEKWQMEQTNVLALKAVQDEIESSDAFQKAKDLLICHLIKDCYVGSRDFDEGAQLGAIIDSEVKAYGGRTYREHIELLYFVKWSLENPQPFRNKLQLLHVEVLAKLNQMIKNAEAPEVPCNASWYFWKFVHNMAIHPMLAFPWESKWVQDWHDWTARRCKGGG